MSSTPLAIETNALTKHFGDTRAVDGIDLAVRAGTVFGVLGPNGAGKTTTIRMLATLLEPTSGSARVLGHDIVRDADAVRAAVSLTPSSREKRPAMHAAAYSPMLWPTTTVDSTPQERHSSASEYWIANSAGCA